MHIQHRNVTVSNCRNLLSHIFGENFVKTRSKITHSTVLCCVCWSWYFEWNSVPNLFQFHCNAFTICIFLFHIVEIAEIYTHALFKQKFNESNVFTKEVTKELKSLFHEKKLRWYEIEFSTLCVRKINFHIFWTKILWKGCFFTKEFISKEKKGKKERKNSVREY